jgi:hypothetical protein
MLRTVIAKQKKERIYELGCVAIAVGFFAFKRVKGRWRQIPALIKKLDDVLKNEGF